MEGEEQSLLNLGAKQYLCFPATPTDAPGPSGNWLGSREQPEMAAKPLSTVWDLLHLRERSKALIERLTGLVRVLEASSGLLGLEGSGMENTKGDVVPQLQVCS